MQKGLQIVRKYPLSLVCFILIWVLSLMPFFPETPLNDINFIDKWTHLIMYGGTCSVLWIEYVRSHTKPNGRKLFLLAWLAPVLMSGLIELLQRYATTTRSGEWMDFAANTLGVTLAALLGMLLVKLWLPRRIRTKA